MRGTILRCTQKILFLFEEKVTIEQYVDLDEVVVLYYLKKWIQEDDAILSDLARRFINRDLFKYIPFDGSIITITELQELFIEGNIDPNYYFVSEAFSDLPYDYDRPGSNRQPIHLLRRMVVLEKLVVNHSLFQVLQVLIVKIINYTILKK